MKNNPETMHKYQYRYWDWKRSRMISEKEYMRLLLKDPFDDENRIVSMTSTECVDRHGEMIFEKDVVAIPERSEIYEVRFGWCGNFDKYAVGLFKPGEQVGTRVDRIGQVTEIKGNLLEDPEFNKLMGYPHNPQSFPFWKRVKDFFWPPISG